jgi:hypothetical protein
MIAERIVNALLEGFAKLPPRPQPIPVRIRRPDGSVIDAAFSGYYEWPGQGYVPSVGYPSASGKLSHGILHQGDTIETPVPSQEEWAAEEKRLVAADAAAPPAKGCFWPTGGSLS